MKYFLRGHKMDGLCRYMHVELLGIIVLVILTAYGSQKRSNGTTAPNHNKPYAKSILKNIRNNHGWTKFPMLYFGAARVKELRKAARTTHRQLTVELKRNKERIMNVSHPLMPPEKYEQFAAHWNVMYGNNLPLLALYYLLHPADKDLHGFILTYMDRMVSYPAWIAAKSASDDLPMAHSLAGFVTAYDFMWPYLDSERRLIYIEKIANVTKRMYRLSYKRPWSRHYLHNHISTNVVSTLMGALVAEVYFEEAAIWRMQSVLLYEKTIKLIQYIKDGSLDEGVGYAGYTFRSMSQYIYLVKRHLGIDHYGLPWLRNHFDFIYFTVLPGMRYTLGIADSSPHWFYGPESQLVFLDTFVLRNGSGNWLAQEIRKHKSHVTQDDQAHSTLHTEFIWLDPTLAPKPPLNHGDAVSMLFGEWGVFIYQSETIDSGDTRSFLSFKSSFLQGRTMFHMANRLNASEIPSFIYGWKSFNPGHEHPDQNSFTYAPKGKMFITEGYYSLKYSHLNNILTFGPSNVSRCTQTTAGQLGDCGTWLRWQKGEESFAHGRILAHARQNNICYVAGEAVGAYHSSLGLKSVERTLLLLDDDILVITDYILTNPDSNLRFTNAHFNNAFYNFSATYFSPGLYGAEINDQGSIMKIFWVTMSGESPKPTISFVDGSLGRHPNRVSNVNVTFKIAKPGEWTKLVFVLGGPVTAMSSLSVEENKNNTDTITLATTDHRQFSITISRPVNVTQSHIVIRERGSDLLTYFPVTTLKNNIRPTEKNKYSMYDTSENLFIPSRLSIALLCIMQVIFMTLVCKNNKLRFSLGILVIELATISVFVTGILLNVGNIQHKFFLKRFKFN